MKSNELRLLDYLSQIDQAIGNIPEYLDDLDYSAFLNRKMLLSVILK